MRLIISDRNLQTIEQVRQFLGGSEALEFRALSVGEKYNCIEEVLIRFRYHRLKRAEKGVIRRYMGSITGYSRSAVGGRNNFMVNFHIGAFGILRAWPSVLVIAKSVFLINPKSCCFIIQLK